MNKQIESFNAGERLPAAENFLWLIVSGVIKSYTVNQAGKTVILGFWGKEEVVGSSLSNVTPYFLQCMNNVEAIAIPKPEWYNLSDSLLNRIQQIQEISHIVLNFQGDRLLLFLQWLANKFGEETSTGIVINFRLTQQELADALGLERVFIGRTLKQLEQENLILLLENQYILLIE